MSFTTIETDIGPGGEIRVEMVLPRLPGGETLAAMVLVEQLGGEPGFEASIDEQLLTPIPSDGRRRLQGFAGRVWSGVAGLTVRLKGAVGARFRIFLGWANRRVRELLARLPCAGCKMAVRSALKAGLAALGLPFLDGGPIAIGPDQVAELIEWEAVQGVADFIDEALGDGAWEVIWRKVAGLLDPVQRAYLMLDRVYRELCRLLGLCPPPERQAAH